MDHQPIRRQPRSNSIGGQEFHLGEYHTQRLKQPIHTLNSPFVDSNQHYNPKARDYIPNQYKHSVIGERSISPSSLSGRPTDFYVPKRSSSIKYPFEKQPLARNQIHTSLECLNTVYSEYNHQNQKQQLLSNHYSRQYPQLHHQQQPQFQHHPTFQNNHYATTYVLAAAPTDTVINQSTEQDLAAAAMAAPQHYSPMLSLGINSSTKMNSVNQSLQAHNNYNSQGAFNNRAAASISQSPLHRRIVHGPVASLLSQITSTSNPLRAGHSSLSLASSTYLIEDKLQNEIKQLQSELKSEKEKNEALNSQLNINSNLMAAFEQSLTTLNSRLRQMTAINERKDKEINQLRGQLDSSNRLTVESSCDTSEKSTSPICNQHNGSPTQDGAVPALGSLQNDTCSQSSIQKNMTNEQTSLRCKQLDEQNLLKVIEDLKRQLIEKDRLLTDTRLEALTAAHQLEQLESRMNGDQSTLVNEDDLDEGVMVVNHSPSDSDAVTDSAHYSDQHNINSSDHYDQNNYDANRQKQRKQMHHHAQRDSNNLGDMIMFMPTHGNYTPCDSHACGLSNNSNHSNDDTSEVIRLRLHQQQQQQQSDNHSDHSSSDYDDEDKSPGDTTSYKEFGMHSRAKEQAFDSHDTEAMNNMLDKLLVSN